VSKVYEVRNREGKSFGLFQYQRSAEQRASQHNRNQVQRVMFMIAKMTGIKRGKNVEAFQAAVDDVNTPFFTVVALNVQY
jgi:hypothetical protein